MARELGEELDALSVGDVGIGALDAVREDADSRGDEEVDGTVVSFGAHPTRWRTINVTDENKAMRAMLPLNLARNSCNTDA